MDEIIELTTPWGKNPPPRCSCKMEFQDVRFFVTTLVKPSPSSPTAQTVNDLDGSSDSTERKQ